MDEWSYAAKSYSFFKFEVFIKGNYPIVSNDYNKIHFDIFENSPKIHNLGLLSLQSSMSGRQMLKLYDTKVK